VKHAFLLVGMILLASCNKNPEDKDHPIYKVIEKHEVLQLKNYKMKLVNAGIPERNQDNVEAIALHYVTFSKMKIPQVRKLIVCNVEQMLYLVNNNEEVESYLKKHPLTYNDIKFNIGFGDIEGEFQEPPHIAYAYLREGKIYYCYHDAIFGDFTEEKDVEEDYETALKIVKGELPKKVDSD